MFGLHAKKRLLCLNMTVITLLKLRDGIKKIPVQQPGFKLKNLWKKIVSHSIS